MQDHWNHVYQDKPLDTLGWYQPNPEPDLGLINSLSLPASAKILIAGAGETTIVEHLSSRRYYKNIILTDISSVALGKLKQRLGDSGTDLQFIEDDLTNPTVLLNLDPVDLWYDRAVLHFFDSTQREAYKQLLLKLVKNGGYVIIGVFSENGATRCSGLDVHRYSLLDLQNFLGKEFELISHLNYDYTMPSGDIRPYIYCIFRHFR